MRQLVFLLDVDNTLLDNDAIKERMAAEVERLLGADRGRILWQVYEDVRGEKGYVDFPATAAQLADREGEPGLKAELMTVLNRFPFSEYLYPHALDTIAYLNHLGEAVVLSDGDPQFQPYKIERSGIAEAVAGRVMVVVHKEEQLDKVFARYPARHYVAVDDKPRIVSALEGSCPATFTTVLVEQGKYAADTAYLPRPDITVATIGDLRGVTRDEFLQPHVRPD